MGGSPVGEYLRARRALVSPADAGIVDHRVRRVAGLRREEVAELAGISPEYYLRLEQGRDKRPSEQVLDALARALRLDAVARLYLRRLAQNRRRGHAEAAAPVDELGGLLELWPHTPAFVVDSNLDVVVANSLADAVGGGTLSAGANLVTGLFEPGSREGLPGWEERAQELVGALRMSGDPDDPRFQQVVGELAIASADFRRLWARQDVHLFVDGDCYLPIQPFGVTRFRWRNFAVEGRRDLRLTVLFAPAGSDAAGALAYASARRGPGGGPADPRAAQPRELSTTTVRS